MDGLGNHLLAGAGFTTDEYCRVVVLCYSGDEIKQAEHGTTGTDHAVKAGILPRMPVLERGFPSLGLQMFYGSCNGIV